MYAKATQESQMSFCLYNSHISHHTFSQVTKKDMIKSRDDIVADVFKFMDKTDIVKVKFKRVWN